LSGYWHNLATFIGVLNRKITKKHDEILFTMVHTLKVTQM